MTVIVRPMEEDAPEISSMALSRLPVMNAAERRRGTGEYMTLSIRRMKERYGARLPSPMTTTNDAEEMALTHGRGDESTSSDGMNTRAAGPSSRMMRAASLASAVAKDSPIGTKREDASTDILTFSSSFFLDLKIILLGKLSVAFLADLDLVPIDLLLVKALDGSPVADRASSPAIVELIADTCSSMCFGHFPLLIRITVLL